MAHYDPVLVRRVPASSGAPQLLDIGPIRWTSLTWEREVGAPGQVVVSSTVDALSDPVKAALLNLLDTPCELWLWRDGDHVHSGPVTNYQITSRRITLTSPGLLAYLNYMTLTDGYSTTANDQASIVKDLIDLYQSQSYGHYGIDTGHLTATGVTRDLEFLDSDLKVVADLVKDLGARDNGFDLAIDPASRYLQLYSPRKGDDRTATTIIDQRAIGYPSYSQSVGPGQIATEVAVSASTTAGAIFTTAESAGTLTTFGRATVSASINDVDSTDTLDDHAARLRDDYETPLEAITPGLLPVSGFGYGDFAEGDVVTYSYDAGLGEQTSTPRIRKLTITMDAGTERLAVDLT